MHTRYNCFAMEVTLRGVCDMICYDIMENIYITFVTDSNKIRVYLYRVGYSEYTNTSMGRNVHQFIILNYSIMV